MWSLLIDFLQVRVFLKFKILAQKGFFLTLHRANFELQLLSWLHNYIFTRYIKHSEELNTVLLLKESFVVFEL